MIKQFFIAITLAIIPFTNASAQWSQQPIEPFPQGSDYIDKEMRVAPDGSTWYLWEEYVMKNPKKSSLIICNYHIQRYDADGKPTFGNDGLIIPNIPNLSYTLVGRRLFTDSDNNALIIVADTRHAENNSSTLSNTCYKISPTGEMLWGNDGITIGEKNASVTIACLDVAQCKSTGDYVFAWFEQHGQNGNVAMQKYSKSEGSPLWNEGSTVLLNDGAYAQYPYLIPSDNDSMILVYAAEQAKNLTAKKIGSDGKNLWAQDICFYNDGWNNTPLHTVLDVRSDGSDGVLIAWNDFHANGYNMIGYACHIKPDGSMPFGDSGVVALSEEEFNAFNVKLMPHGNNGETLVVYRKTNDSQNYQGLMLQKLDKDGNLLWDIEETVVEPIDRLALSAPYILPDEDDLFAIAYKKDLGTSQKIYISRFKTIDGSLAASGDKASAVIAESTLNLSIDNIESYVEGKFHVFQFSNTIEGISHESQNLQRLNFDLTYFGNPTSVKNISANNSPNFYSDGNTIHVPAEIACNDVALYDVAGNTIANIPILNHKATLPQELTAGIYFAAIQTSAGNTTIKIIHNK